MRRGIGLALIGIGAALLVLAAMVKFWAVPQLAVAPLDLDPNSPSVSTGTAVTLLDIATLTEQSNVPVTSTRYTTADVAASQSAGGNTGVYETFSRLNRDTDGELVTASTQRYAFDRTTSVLQTGSGSNLDGEPITDEQIAGDAIMPLKMPFFVDKNATYNYFDTTVVKGVPLTFVEETSIDGLTVYKFEQTIEPVQIGEQEGLGERVGGDASFVAPRYYTNYRVLFVEPITGQVVNGFEEQKQTFRGPDGTDKITIIDAKIGFTEEGTASAVEEAKTNSAALGLLANTVPMVGFILGAVLVVVGFLLARRTEDA